MNPPLTVLKWCTKLLFIVACVNLLYSCMYMLTKVFNWCWPPQDSIDSTPIQNSEKCTAAVYLYCFIAHYQALNRLAVKTASEMM